jgi:hypothetical protein
MSLSEILKRHGALVRKIAAGTANDAEKAEVLRLQEAVDAAAAATAEPEFTTVTMTLAEFQAHAEMELADMDKAPDADRIARLQRNLKAIREQGKSAPDDVVAVEVKTKSAEPSIVDALDARLAALLPAAAEKTEPDPAPAAEAAPVPETPAAAEKTEPAPAAEAAPAAPEPVAAADEPEFDKASISQQIAVEALEALTIRLSDLKSKIGGGSISAEDYDKAFEGWWSLQDVIRTFTAVAASAPAGAAPVVAASADAPPPAADPAAEVPEVAKGWSGLSPRMSHEQVYKDLRRGASRIRNHQRATE